MKKFNIIILLSIVILPSCFKKKIEPKKDQIIVSGDENFKKTQTFSEDAQEFVLEDDSNFNAFDDKKPSLVESQDDLDWAELEENKEEKTGTVQFDYSSSNIKPVQEAKIKSNTKLIKDKLQKNDKAKVLVKGHSCKIAKNKEYNYALSQERAYKVAKAYENAGVPHKNVKSVGFGATMLLTDKDGMEEQAINRRAETVISE